MSVKPPPTIPDQSQVFCGECQRWMPRSAIVAARWIRGGQQARYCCRPCKDLMDRRRLTKGPH